MNPAQPIPGSRIKSEPAVRGIVACRRCGRRRQAHGSLASERPLCADCKYVLSEEEQKMWMDAA